MNGPAMNGPAMNGPAMTLAAPPAPKIRWGIRPMLINLALAYPLP